MATKKIDPRIEAHGVPVEEVKHNIEQGCTLCILYESSRIVLDKWLPVYHFTTGDRRESVARNLVASEKQGETRNAVFIVMK